MKSPGQMLQIATEVQRASVRMLEVLEWARAAAQVVRRCGRDVSSQASRGRMRRRDFVAGGHRTAGDSVRMCERREEGPECGGRVAAVMGGLGGCVQRVDI
jgi:hypothetical protein